MVETEREGGGRGAVKNNPTRRSLFAYRNTVTSIVRVECYFHIFSNRFQGAYILTIDGAKRRLRVELLSRNTLYVLNVLQMK